MNLLLWIFCPQLMNFSSTCSQILTSNTELSTSIQIPILKMFKIHISHQDSKRHCTVQALFSPQNLSTLASSVHWSLKIMLSYEVSNYQCHTRPIHQAIHIISLTTVVTNNTLPPPQLLCGNSEIKELPGIRTVNLHEGKSFTQHLLCLTTNITY